MRASYSPPSFLRACIERSRRTVERRGAERWILGAVAERARIGEGGIVGRQIRGGERRRTVVDRAQERDQIRDRRRIAVEDVGRAAGPGAPVRLRGGEEVRVGADAERLFERGRLAGAKVGRA